MTAFATRLTHLLRPTFAVALLAMLGNWANVNAQTGAPLPPAGTNISNQASANYQLGDVTVNLLSNRVQLTVSSVEALRLTADTTRTVTVGAPVTLPHRLTNTGNVATSYAIGALNLSGDDFDLSDLRVYADTNGNGNADAGEPRLDDNPNPISLAAGQSLDLLITSTTPVSARPGQSARVQINAATQSGAARADNTDTVRVAAGVAIEVRKNATPENAARGQIVSYDLTAISRGSAAPDPTLVQVDGAPRAFVLLRDTVPSNTTLES